MTRDEALHILEAHADDLRARGVRQIALFGSTARDEARDGSDVDLLVDLDPERKGWQDLVGLHDYLEGLFGCAVDVALRDRLKPFLRDRILAEAEGRFVTPTPPRSPRQALEDMLQAIGRIEQASAGRTLDDYRGDWLVHDAIERNIARLSEASRRLPKDLKASHPELPWQRIADIGNVLRHAYDSIDDEKIWSIVANHLASLKAAVLAMIAEWERTGGA